MPLTEAEFTILVDRGCPSCTSKRLLIESLVTESVPLLGGEVYGSPTWSYKGEHLVDGTFRIACEECAHEIYAATACPRCTSAGGVARALETMNAFMLPTRCTQCGSERMTAAAIVPARVVYEGKRAQKARTDTTPDDEGFHALEVSCKSCRATTRATGACVLCGGL